MDGDDGARTGTLDRLSDEQRVQAVTMLITEHTALQTARSATIFESTGRVTVYLGTVSSAIVALAFIGQVSGLGTAFFAFGLVLSPTLFFLGVATYFRVLQTGVEDLLNAIAVNRIRHVYVALTPQIAPYLMRSMHDDDDRSMEKLGLYMGRWQMFLTAAGMVGVINSVIAGVFAGLAVAEGFDRSLAFSFAAGGAVFLLIVAAHQVHQAAAWRRIGERSDALFPSRPRGADPAATDR